MSCPKSLSLVDVPTKSIGLCNGQSLAFLPSHPFWSPLLVSQSQDFIFSLNGAALIHGTDTGDRLLLVDIEICTPCIDNFYRPSSRLLSPGDADHRKSLLIVLPHQMGGKNSGCFIGIRVTLGNGLAAPNKTDLSSRRHRRDITEAIFMVLGARKGMDVRPRSRCLCFLAWMFQHRVFSPFPGSQSPSSSFFSARKL